MYYIQQTEHLPVTQRWLKARNMLLESKICINPTYMEAKYHSQWFLNVSKFHPLYKLNNLLNLALAPYVWNFPDGSISVLIAQCIEKVPQNSGDTNYPDHHAQYSETEQMAP